MPTVVDPIILRAQTQFSASVLAVLEERRMKKSDLARASEAIGGPSKKTVYNILNKKHPPNIAQWAQLAQALEIPLWVLLIDDVHKHRDLLNQGGLKRLVGVVESYLASKPEKRAEIETVADSARITSRLDKTK
jgi:hypothetical protein